MDIFHFAGTGVCKPQTIHLMAKNPVDVSTFCTQKPQILNPFRIPNVYRANNVSGIYRLSRNELHICYNAQVLPNMTSPAQLSGGKYYEIQ